MTTESNKALVRRYFEEVWTQMDQRATTQFISPKFVAHNPAFPDDVRGPEGVLQTTGMIHAAFPDLHYDLHDLVAEGDKVVVRWSASGTHRGPFQGFPATGKQVTTTGIEIFRLGESQLEEAWVNADFLSVMKQLGMIPARR